MATSNKRELAKLTDWLLDVLERYPEDGSYLRLAQMQNTSSEGVTRDTRRAPTFEDFDRERAEALAAEFLDQAQEDADSMGAQQVYAVFLENKHHELLVRSSPFRVHPRAPAQSAYFETGPDGQSALLQHLVITFADQLTRVDRKSVV